MTRYLRRSGSVLRWFASLALIGFIATGCLGKVERVCNNTSQCTGFNTQHVCFQSKCVPGVCEPDPNATKPQDCFCKPGETNCAQEPKGACAVGVRYCIDNGRAWSSCYGAILPSKEICDGADNDCDGEVDEGLTCECKPHERRPCQTGMSKAQIDANNSACRMGTQQCQRPKDTDSWTWGPCQHHHQPGRIFGTRTDAISTCQQSDLNCDGKPDKPELDNCTCTKLNETRSCYTGPATTLGKTSPDGKASPCQKGTQTCIPITSAQGQWSLCQKQVLPVAEEDDPCNGQDDDCDGIIDNSTGTSLPLWRRCGTNDGDCQIEICLDGAKWSKCESQEICNNNQDDNCDGKVDESTCFRP